MGSTSAPTAAMGTPSPLLSDVLSPSRKQRGSRMFDVVRGAPQTESSAPPQHAAAAAHTSTLTVEF
eukprot:scaffold75990_cov48-Phaeocystis_antarctica.AAC.2